MTYRKATIVMEHLIQASDVAHTMQHWLVFRKWNEKLFSELYKAYKQGRSSTNPADGWYKGAFLAVPSIFLLLIANHLLTLAASLNLLSQASLPSWISMVSRGKSARGHSGKLNGLSAHVCSLFCLVVIPLANKLADCGVFGVSSDEYKQYAETNRREWKEKGAGVVAEMVEACESAKLWEQQPQSSLIPI